MTENPMDISAFENLVCSDCGYDFKTEKEKGISGACIQCPKCKLVFYWELKEIDGICTLVLCERITLEKKLKETADAE